ncbi:MAG: OsmC family protein [Anaerolineales bacterium]|nr:OsmC family protein [Anaerolineales bacterium]MCZ2122947.1 OsmC family protein [Anaerolineales bacterium]
MASKQVQLSWTPAESFVLKDKDDLQILMKKPKGVSASDLLPMSLIGCSSHDVVEILKKQKQNLLQLKVTAEATQDDDPPWKFRAIRIHYQAIGSGLSLEKLEKAIQLSKDKYCSVYATLKDAVEITHTFEIREA